MHNPWVGVDLARDPVAWARLVRCAYDVALSGRGTPPVLRDVIVRSWARCAEAGVDAERPAPRMFDEDETRQRLDAHSLAIALPLLHELLADVAQDARHLAVLADECGLLLWSGGHPSMIEAATEPRFVPGCVCSERVLGTNAIGTALVLDHAVQVFSAEHFNRRLHGWTTAAAPVHDPDTGGLIGAIGLTGSFRRAHPHSLALVGAAARLAEAELADRQASRDRALEARYVDLVARSRPRRSALITRGGRVLVATPPGWLGDRLELPASTGEATVDGGLRLAIEPLGQDGSIVWDAVTKAAPPRPRLDLRALGRNQAEVEVLSQRILLGKRHSELVVLLALNPRGLTGEELAHAMYGESGREVTVRAEMARLRRRLGPMVASQPYRLVADVRADFLEVQWLARRGALAAAMGAYVGPLLPGSDIPAIAEARAALEEACPSRPWREGLQRTVATPLQRSLSA
ncbi:MAG: GAF domain-containing protein [Solirubrobacteraceae bacterium]